MNFSEAFAAVGIAFAILIGILGFFWLLSTSGPNDYVMCLNKCTDGWGQFKNLECPEMCLPLSEDYKVPFNETLDNDYWYDNGTEMNFNNIGSYYPPACYTNQEDFLNQFPNQTMPAVINYYAIYCHNPKWWWEVYEK